MSSLAAASTAGWTATIQRSRPTPPPPTGKGPSGRRWLRRPRITLRLMSSVMIAVLTCIVAFVGFSSNTPAHAFPGLDIGKSVCKMFDSDDSGPQSETYRSGVDSLIPAISPVTGQLEQSLDVSVVGGSTYGTKPVTAYEWFGTSGLTFSSYLKTDDDGIKDGCSIVTTTIVNMFANFMFQIPKAITTLSIGLLQWASAPDLLSDFLNPVDCIVNGSHCSGGGNPGGLKVHLYLNFLPVMILFGALYMGWVGLVKKRSTEAYQAAIWMLASAAFALVFMAMPSTFANWGNNAVSTVNSIAMTSVTATTSTATGEQDICYLPSGAEKAGIRMASCSIYKAFLYSPWATGQFGVGPSAPLPKVSSVNGKNITIGNRNVSDIRIAMIQGQAFNHDQQLVAQGVGGGQADALQKQNQADWQGVRTAMKDQSGYYGAWRGAGNAALNRLNLAFAAIVASIMGGILIVLISFSIVVLALGMLMLILLAPLFLLVGAHPGFGRGIALKWLEMLIGTVAKRIILGFLLSVIVGCYQIILSTPDQSFLVQTSMIIAIGLAAIIYRKPMLEAFNIVSLGGTSTGLENTDALKNKAKQGMSFGVGALVGGLTGMKAGGLGAGLQGAARGGMSGSRSGTPLRAGMVGAAAGRRAGSRSGRGGAQRPDDDGGVGSPLYDADDDVDDALLGGTGSRGGRKPPPPGASVPRPRRTAPPSPRRVVPPAGVPTAPPPPGGAGAGAGARPTIPKLPTPPGGRAVPAPMPRVGGAPLTYPDGTLVLPPEDDELGTYGPPSTGGTSTATPPSPSAPATPGADIALDALRRQQELARRHGSSGSARRPG